MNGFEKMCKNLEVYKNEEKKYSYVKEALKEYIQDDHENLIQIKAEAEEGDFLSYASFIFSLVALGITVYESFPSLFGDAIGDYLGIYKCIIGCGIAGIFMYAIFKVRKFICVYRWRKYIQVGIREIEEEMNKHKGKKQKEKKKSKNRDSQL